MPYNFKKYVRGTIERVIKKFDKAKATDNEYYLFNKLNNLPVGGNAVQSLENLQGTLRLTSSDSSITISNDGIDSIDFVSIGGGGGATSLATLSDVNLSFPTNGQVLKYNGTDWVNGTDNAGGGGGGSDVFPYRRGSSYITALYIGTGSLSLAPVGTRTQLIPIYIPFNGTVSRFRTENRNNVANAKVSFGLYSFTNPIENGELFQLVGGATDFDCSTAGIIDAAPDSPLTVTKGWYMLAMFRNTEATSQEFLQFPNTALFNVFGWNDFKSGSGPNANGFALMYVNSTTNLAGNGLPATINEETGLDWAGSSNMLAFSLVLIP